MNYLFLILDGWIASGEFLPDYFYREFKKAEKEHIGWKEFLMNLENVVKSLRKEIDKPYYEQLHLWYMYDAQQRARGEPVGMDKPEKTDSGMPLLFLTNQKYTGHIWGRDVDYIEKSFNEGCEKLLREKGLFPLFFYAMPEKTIIPSEVAIIDPAKLQKVIKLSQQINDLAFKKELETKEPEQIDEYLDFHLRCYLRNEGLHKVWLSHTRKLMPLSFSPRQKDAYLLWMENNEQDIETTANTDDNEEILKDIFTTKAEYIVCMDALKNVKDPVISTDNNYLLGPKQKGAFTAWYEVVKYREKFKQGIVASDVAKFLNKEINGLELGEDGTTLRRTGTTMYKKYKVLFTKLII